MQVNTKSYILDEFKNLIGEEISVLSEVQLANSMRRSVFPNNVDIKEKFDSEVNNYLNCIKYQRKLCWFLFKKEKKLNYNCIDRTIEMIEKYGNDSFTYIDSLIAMMKTACEMEADYKFYLPRKKFEYIDEEKYKQLINLASGFDIQVVKDFIIGHDIFNLEEFNDVYSKAKIVNFPKGDNSFYGVFDNAMVIPKVVDDKSALVNVHELVHKSLVMNEEYIRNDEIVYGEELPIFYEMLYKAYNGLVKCDTNYNEISEKLLLDYNSEPFMEQVKKLEKIK